MLIKPKGDGSSIMVSRVHCGENEGYLALGDEQYEIKTSRSLHLQFRRLAIIERRDTGTAIGFY